MSQPVQPPAGPSPALSITGGAGGVDARLEDLATLGRHSRHVAGEFAATVAACHRIVIDPDVVASTVLDPVGAARFETAMLELLDGPGGLSALALRYASRALVLAEIANAYHAVDEACRSTIDGLRWMAGYTVLPAVAGLGLVTVVAELPAFLVVGGVAALTGTGDELGEGGLAALNRVITEFPGLVDLGIGAGPGFMTHFLPPGHLVPNVPSAAGIVGLTYPEGTPACSDGVVDLGDDTMKSPPENFTNILDGLSHRSKKVGPGQPDQIDVRVITHPNGTKAYVVDIPGTQNWDLPGSFTSETNNLGTNVHAMAGEVTTREKAIAMALEKAGASPTDPVMLVGHSQGGIVAAQAAHDSGGSGFPYNVTHVVTAASPIARIDVPDRVQVLSIENTHDIVPHLDAADNRDRPNRTTVTFSDQNGTVEKNHEMKTYSPIGGSLDASNDPSIKAYRDSAKVFFDGSQVTAIAYDLSRT